jgi:hypothetical protein
MHTHDDNLHIRREDDRDLLTASNLSITKYFSESKPCSFVVTHDTSNAPRGRLIAPLSRDRLPRPYQRR